MKLLTQPRPTRLVWLLLFCSLSFSVALAQSRVLWRQVTDWGRVEVHQSGDLRKLMFVSESGLTEESRMSVSQPFRPQQPYVRQMLAATACWQAGRQPGEAPPDRFLVVGLGGASLSNALATLFPSAEVVSIEIEPAVVEAARKFFWYQESQQVQTVTEDARSFLERDPTKYDVIYLDAFDGTGVPDTLRTVEFAQILARHLEPGGAVVANIHLTPRPPSLRYQASLTEVFPRRLLLPGLGQAVGLFSSDATLAVSSLLEQEEEMGALYKLPLSELVQNATQPETEGAAPFRDSETSSSSSSS